MASGLEQRRCVRGLLLRQETQGQDLSSGGSLPANLYLLLSLLLTLLGPCGRRTPAEVSTEPRALFDALLNDSGTCVYGQEETGTGKRRTGGRGCSKAGAREGSELKTHIHVSPVGFPLGSPPEFGLGMGKERDGPGVTGEARENGRGETGSGQRSCLEKGY